jgi:hypothetical protein
MQQNTEIFEANLTLAAYYHPFHQTLLRTTYLPENTKEESFEPIDYSIFEGYKTLVLYGFEEGKLVESLFEWLDADVKRRLIVCDFRPWVYKKFLHQENIQDFIQKKRLHLLICPDVNHPQSMPMLNSIFSGLFLTLHCENAFFIEHPMIVDTTGQRKKLFNNIIEQALSVFYSQKMYLEGHQHKSFINRCENTTVISEFKMIDDLRQTMKGQSCVLCGAGFSLPKVYQKLQEISYSTLIAAAGTAGTLLARNGIESHFNGIMDVTPDITNTSQYNLGSSTLFYYSRAGCEAVCQHNGLKLVCDEDSEKNHLQELFGFEFEKTDSQSHPFNYFTVADFMLHQLIKLGFSTIYICGVDHILSKEKYYGDDVIKMKGDDAKAMFCHAENIHGEDVLTKFDWHQGTRNIERIISRYPDINFVYVTDEGLKISGVKQISTQEFCELEFHNETCAETLWLENYLKAKSYKTDPNYIIDYLTKLYESCNYCNELFKQTDIELGKLYSCWQVSPIDDLNPFTGPFFEIQKKLNEEIAYTKFLEPTWRSFKTQIHIDSGFFEEIHKIKLTLFALKTRELDFYKQNVILFAQLFMMQKKQIEERFARKENNELVEV